jgi:hypothetical protein
MRQSFVPVDAGRAVDEFTRGITGLLKSSSATSAYRALAGVEAMKSAFQQMHNYNHTIGMVAAKAFLEREFPQLPWEEIEFAGRANRPGPDIRVDRPPVRIVGELKTTEPCGRTDRGATIFGGDQPAAIAKDLRRLASLQYDGFARYMFVTSGLAYECLVRDYRQGFPTICYVLLSVKPKVSRPQAVAE